MKTNVHLWQYLAHFFLEWEIFRTKVVEKIKIYILSSIIFFFENHTVYEIMWKNTVEPGRQHVKIFRMRIACWAPTSTNAHPEHVMWFYHFNTEHIIVIAFLMQQFLHDRAWMLPSSCWSLFLDAEILFVDKHRLLIYCQSSNPTTYVISTVITDLLAGEGKVQLSWIMLSVSF